MHYFHLSYAVGEFKWSNSLNRAQSLRLNSKPFLPANSVSRTCVVSRALASSLNTQSVLYRSLIKLFCRLILLRLCRLL